LLVAAVAATGTAAGCSVSLTSANLSAWRVPTAAMEPTLQSGDVVYTQPGHAQVRVGEVVIFHPPRGALRGGLGVCGEHTSGRYVCADPIGGRSSTFYIKRVVALGGQRIAIFGGHVVLDGKEQHEPFALTSGCGLSPICTFPIASTIPRGYAFMLGDNRADSDDSRFWGPVPLSWIVGVVQTCDHSHKRCRVLGSSGVA